MPTSRRFGGNSSILFSPMMTCPTLCWMKPAMIRSSVVLPQPEGPSSAINSPALMSSVTLSTANAAP